MGYKQRHPRYQYPNQILSHWGIVIFTI